MTLKGLLIKGYNGFYYVETEGRIWSCSLRGRFRIKKQRFLPGDRVKFTVIDPDKGCGVIEELFPRQNELIRPPVANVDKVVITFALHNPKPDLLLLDRILIQVLQAGIEPLICFNKADLVTEGECDAILSPYVFAGYDVIAVSAYSRQGIDKLKLAIHGKLIVMAGPSGAGKSSILNAIDERFHLATGELSKKVERGKHTTRRVELLPLEKGTYLADTPGFSSLFLPDKIERSDLQKFYPEFAVFAQDCPYTSCLHDRERDCGVKNAVTQGSIDAGRYERYCLFLEELKEREGKY